MIRVPAKHTQSTFITRVFARGTCSVELHSTYTANVIFWHIPSPGRYGVPFFDSDLHNGNDRRFRRMWQAFDVTISVAIGWPSRSPSYGLHQVVKESRDTSWYVVWGEEGLLERTVFTFPYLSLIGATPAAMHALFPSVPKRYTYAIQFLLFLLSKIFF